MTAPTDADLRAIVGDLDVTSVLREVLPAWVVPSARCVMTTGPFPGTRFRVVSIDASWVEFRGERGEVYVTRPQNVGDEMAFEPRGAETRGDE